MPERRDSGAPGAPAPALPLAPRVGIDVGGTKTHIAALTEHGERIDLVVPSATWRTGSLFSDPENLPRLAELVGSVARIGPESSVAAGMHGCDTPGQVAVAESTLSAVLGTTVTVMNDAQLLGHAAGETECLEMIVGTGAVIVGRDAEGTRMSADGYGWLLSDYGSAPALVRESVREALRRHDRGTLGDDPLIAALRAAFHAADITELALAVTLGAGLTEWGSHAPLVFEHLEGSEVARTVVDDAARRLAESAESLVARGAVGDSIVAAGGVMVNQPRLQDALARELATRLPGHRLTVLLDPPVDGALALAGSVARVRA